MKADTMRTFADVEKLLANRLPDYVSRSQQQRVALFIEECLDSGEHGMVQAPVGTGKSFAALIPSILRAANNGERVVIATANNALADQYANKDMPFLIELLSEHLGEISWAVVKGMSHYVCSAELAEASDVEVAHAIREELRANPRHTGEFNAFSFQISPGDRRTLSVSSQECPGLKNCKIGQELGCFPRAARNAAQEASIVLTNISALISNAQLDGRVLGDYDALIVDEGHNLDSIALGALEQTVNFAGLRDLVKRAEKHLGQAGVNFREMNGAIDWVENHTFRLFDGVDDQQKVVKINHEELLDRVDDWFPIFEGLQGIKVALGSRVKMMLEQLGDSENDPEKVDTSRMLGLEVRNMSKVVKQAEGTFDTLEMLFFEERDVARWATRYEVKIPGKSRVRDTEVRVMLSASPIDTAPFLSTYLWDGFKRDREEGKKMPPVILMSGTLAPGGDFQFIKRTVGGRNAREITVDSPFDFPNQAGLYVPGAMVPAPNQEGWEEWYMKTTERLVSASRGSALLLFTSRRMMEEAYNVLSPKFSQEYKCLVQDGETSPKELGRIFNEEKSSILFALRSFFEGFDPALGSCRIVVLDKLPFPVPTEVITEARAQKIDAEEGPWSSFRKLSIPQMSLALVQATGRLIRSDRHRGLMAIMDSRLKSKSYGSQIIDSLPPARRMGSLSEAEEFLKKIS